MMLFFFICFLEILFNSLLNWTSRIRWKHILVLNTEHDAAIKVGKAARAEQVNLDLILIDKIFSIYRDTLWHSNIAYQYFSVN